MKCVLALVSVASAFVAQPRVLPARTVRAAEAPTMVTGKQVAAGLAAGIIFGGAAASQAIELDEATRTVAADPKTNVVLTVEQVKRGKRLFNSACATCHTGGITKTNPNVGLDTEALSFATPQRNTIVSLVDYMKDPTTYDGLESIAEIHPAVKSADIFPKMRALTEDDLEAIAGHILLQPAIVAEKWGGGKIYY